MNTTATIGQPQATRRLLAWLAEHDVEFEVHEHPIAFTAPATARAEGVDPKTFAKVVAVECDGGRRALLVLDAPDRVDLQRAREVLGARDVRLLSEGELLELAPDCEVGALPAVGALYGLPLYADHGVRKDEEISFYAGTHRHSVRVDRDDWEEATGVTYVDLALERVGPPAWAR